MVDLKGKPSAEPDLSELVLNTLNSFPGIKRYIIALSGGVDSIVLTHLMGKLRPNLNARLLAVHVNHGLHAEADQWQQHCQTVCDTSGIEFAAETVTVTNEGKGVEAAARDQRYAALAKYMQPGDALLTAHHCVDQAETVLMNLLRGAGVKGLAAMPAQKPFHGGLHIRPLLPASKSQIEAYAEQQHLEFMEDPSNKDVSYTRNYIRQQLMPELRQRWPGLDTVLSRAASNMSDASELLDDLAGQDLKQIQKSPEAIDLQELEQLSMPRQRNALRYWLSAYQINPGSQHLDAIFSDCVDASEDAAPEIEFANHHLKRYRKTLYILPATKAAPPAKAYSWHLSESLSLPELGLQLDPGSLLSRNLDLSEDDEVELRFRQGGEKFKPDRQGMRKSLKAYFQETGLPPWERDLVPLIYKNGELIAVWGTSSNNP